MLAALVLSSTVAVAPAMASTITNATWSASSVTPGATNVTYSYRFTAVNGANLNTIMMTVPPGTSAGSTGPQVTKINAFTGNVNTAALNATSVALDGSNGTLTVTLSGKPWVAPSDVVSIDIGGLTNTGQSASYPSTIKTETISGTTTTVVDTGLAPAVTFTGTSLSGATYSTTSSKTGAGPTNYTYSFTLPSGSGPPPTTVTMSLPPGTAVSGGTQPSLGNVTPAAGGNKGTINLQSSGMLLYTFPSGAALAAGMTVTITVTGLTNTAISANYASEIIAYAGATILAAATTPAITFTATTLVSPSWATTSTTSGSTATYSYRFVTVSSANLSQITMTVPPGTTAGTARLTVITATASSPNSQNGGIDLKANAGAQASLDTSLNLLTVSFETTQVSAGFAISIDVGGFTNTATPGTYGSSITTWATSAANPVDSGVAPGTAITNTTLTGASWSPGSTVTGSTNVTYTYTFGLPPATTIDAVALSLPPGTVATGSSLGTITPSSLRGGTLSISGNSLLYTLGDSATFTSAATVTIPVTGLTNPSTPGAYTTQITVYDQGAPLAATVTAPVTFTTATLNSPTWASTSTAVGSATTYTWGFTTSAQDNLSTVTMTVPPGTTVGSGGLHLGDVTIYSPRDHGDVDLTGQQISISGTTLTYTIPGVKNGSPVSIGPGTVFSISVTGLVTSPQAGTYTSAITTINGSTLIASATTNTLSLSNTTLGTPIWSVDSTATSSTSVNYTYRFTVSVSAPVATVTMTVPAGTGSSCALTATTITPAAMQGGNVSFSPDGTKLVYSLNQATTIPPGTNASITIGCITNTPTAGSYSSAITVEDSGTAVLASAVTTPITFSSPASLLTNVSWQQSSQATSQPATYTYCFTTPPSGTNTNLDTAMMTVPIGTSIASSTTATVRYATGTTCAALQQGSGISLPGATLKLLSGTTLSVALPSKPWIVAGTTFFVQVTGITNTPTPGPYSSAISTMLSGAIVNSGITTLPSVFVGGPLAAGSWTADQATAGSDAVSYTFTFTTASTSTLTKIAVALPTGTQGAGATLGTATSGIPGDGTVSMSGATLTYDFSTAPETVEAGTALTLQVDGMTNTATAGSYIATVTTFDGTAQIDQGITDTVTFNPETLTFTNECTTQVAGCLAENGGTALTLLAIPGGGPASASVTLGVTTNAAHGYSVATSMTPLARTGGSTTIAQAPLTGVAAASLDTFSATATLSGSAHPSATLCLPYSVGPVGYATDGSPAGVWYAGGGDGTDSLVLRNSVQASAVLPAGTYTGTITYAIRPAYTGTPSC